MPDDPEDTVDQIDPSEFAALKAELAAARLDTAMLTAGIDLDSPTGKMFRKAWDGEADAEAIKAAAGEIPGALRAVPEPPTPDITDESREVGEADQFKDRQALASGDAAGAEDPDPKQVAFGALDEEIQNGVRLEDGIANTMRSLVQAANAGDPRVLAGRNG